LAACPTRPTLTAADTASFWIEAATRDAAGDDDAT
jgi:hypothetical protein